MRHLKTGSVQLSLEHPGEGQLERPVFASDETIVVASKGATTIVGDMQSRHKIDAYTLDFGSSYPSVFAKSIAPDKRSVFVWSWNGPQRWPLHHDSQSVIENAQHTLSRCLSTTQRRRYVLPLAPPPWCITGAGLEQETDPRNWQAKWPYQDSKWQT